MKVKSDITELRMELFNKRNNFFNL